jgi:hypothetical protein
MALKFEVEKLEDVPEPARGFYESKDGKFVLGVEGAASGRDLNDANVKLVEFRDNNVKLLKALGVESIDSGLARAALIAGIDPAKLERLKAIDPDEFARLKAAADELKKKGVTDPADIDTRVTAALEAALAPVRQELASEKQARATAQGRADEALLRQSIGEKALKAGLQPGALDFLIAKAHDDFHVVDNAVKAKDNKFSADKPGQPLGVDEWLAGKMKEFGFAFAASQGGGAGGGSGNGAGARPGAKQLVNPTPQELGRLKHVSGKGLVNQAGEVVEVVVTQ